MSTKILKRYQEKAVHELIIKSRLLLNKKLSNPTIVFQSPTGSGKTLMMTEYIEQFIEDQEGRDVCFLWISIGKGELHTQSYYSLKREFNGFPVAHLLEQEFFGSRETISANEVVVANWEKLRAKDNKTGEWKNILMKDSETVNFRELVRNTKESGTMIVLIIDESHSNSSSERAKELRGLINANLTIEMSATPVLVDGDYNEKVRVESNDVIEEGMIKKEIIINDNIEEIAEEEDSSQELILRSALLKREELKFLYKKLGLSINPLVLIQLPTGQAGEEKRDFVEAFLASKGIGYENNKLAIWLNDEKINNEREFVTPNNSQVDFLIFKQAIDTGWDCPRACILVRFREIKSLVFEIQTVGRILRMPEAMHYDDDRLNRGYVYTNVKSFIVKEETYNPNIIKSVILKRKDLYQPLKLKSYYRNRIDFGDITLSFYKVLEKTFCEYFGIHEKTPDFFNSNREKVASKISLDDTAYEDGIICSKPLDTALFDKLPEQEISGREADLFSKATLMQTHLSYEDLMNAFEFLIKINLNGYAPKRSISRVKEAVYVWFHRYLNTQKYNLIYIQNVVMNNCNTFSELFDKAIRDYKPTKEKEILKKIEETETWDNEWEIAKSRNYNPNTYIKYNYKHCLYEPCYLKIDSNIEKDFIEYLEENEDAINWWWQNGNEHMALNFGIKYNTQSTFQPDFIIQFADGRLGIFDTKASGYNENDNKLKADALRKYIQEQDRNIVGGLVVREGQHFRVNLSDDYKSFTEAPEDWCYFKDILK